MRSVIFALLWFGVSALACAAERPVIKACTEDNDSYPWLLKDRVGATVFLLNLVEKQLGLRLEIVALPWKRCMAELRAGSVDALFKISFSPERAAEIGVYPMQGDKPDPSKRLLIDSYSLYRLKGSNTVLWDGKTLQVAGGVGAQTGFSVVELLKKTGVAVDEGGRAAESHLRKLVLGRVGAVALQTEEGDNAVQSDAEFRERIERVSPVLVEKPYFLIFSRQFQARQPKLAASIWNGIEVARESGEYKKYLQSFR
jgi:polar amino acid transport system substrate-binding protein